MGSLIRLLMPMTVLRPILRPVVRVVVGLVAVPVFRVFLKRVVRLDELDRELEKDLEQWFRGSLLLLVATANMEHILFGWVPVDLQGDYAWLSVGLRVMLAIGVIEAMPDQELFSVIHPGPPKLKWPKEHRWSYFRSQCWPCCRGLACQHLNRSSPVFAIMAAIFGGPAPPAWQLSPWLVGWVCYFLAITQYLIIGLVTSRDKAIDVLSEFDKQVARRRQELVEEFSLDPTSRQPQPATGEAADGEAPSAGQTVGTAVPAVPRSVQQQPTEIVAKKPDAGYVSE